MTYAARRPRETVTCDQCLKHFVRYASDIQPGRQFCSRDCKHAARRARTIATFWDRVARTEGCWEWTGPRVKQGYGKVGSEASRTHRLAWTLTYGPIPAGLDVCHTCDNPPCCRPDHLRLGTRGENMRDAARKGRTLQGERHPMSKLTSAQVYEIRARYALDPRPRTIAREYGVGRDVIHRIVRGTLWRSLL